ncbi:hypothetical protein HaLaN_22048 [Haematococcus lacustris]|uniref:Uncharacterized protein n=1 Tax=Haematococcus lacustris TaxID=44745 RepID=A0A699ZNN1_HAELA|nr:hypothetical protein HaLaN_22048 [Haematococcus lacustris]
MNGLGSATQLSAAFGTRCLVNCDGYAVVCCVEEEGVGWVVKRSKTGAGFTTLFSLDFQPMGFAVNGTSFWICSYDRSIMEYSAAGVCLQRIAGPAGAYMEFLGNTLFTVAYNNKCDPDLCCMDKMGRTVKLLVNHVKPSGSFALFPAAQKLLFISSRNNFRGDLLFIDQPDKALPRICCLPALLPPPEASASKILIPKGSQVPKCRRLEKSNPLENGDGGSLVVTS